MFDRNLFALNYRLDLFKQTIHTKNFLKYIYFFFHKVNKSLKIVILPLCRSLNIDLKLLVI